LRSYCTGCNYHGGLKADKIGSQLSHDRLTFPPPELDGHVLTLNISGVSETTLEISYDPGGELVSRNPMIGTPAKVIGAMV
jgi:hypothetical protein